ncbi:MAG TPA: hypothetical protein VL400_27555 [Polyangiaceae bacterium]|jgi:uncharacterized membrane-anchored protein|nr:hypothetical protein [Polyangiaceae bacterium]
MNRVPHIIALYWVIKIAATTLGETGADMFSMTWDLGYGATIGIFMALFLASFGIKLAAKGYHPVLYWLTFTTSAIVGTAMSDFIDRTLELGYAVGSLLLVLLLLSVLAAWYRSERSIQVETITTPRAEIFYWLAFLVANTLGTAAGDFLADDLELGFVTSAVGISAVLVVLALLHYLTRAPRMLLFWLAFVLTRPFGATFGDFLTKPSEEGGIAFGTVGASIVFGGILVAAIARETQLERRRAATPGPVGPDR